MKIYSALAIVTAMLVMEPPLRAQSCWDAVDSWTGNYTLTGKTAGAVTCGTDRTCTTDQSITVPANLLNISTCSMLQWAAIAEQASSVSVNDTVVTSCGAGGGNSTETFDGATGAISDDYLIIDVASGTYEFFTVPLASGTDTDVGCDGSTSSEPYSDAYPLYPITNWPLTFAPLPKYVQPLSSGLSFQAPGEPGGGEVGYEFSFTLTPHYNPDDDCKQAGNSSIGCQSQSLGEDIPVAGTGFHLHFESGRAPGSGGNGVASADAAMLGGWTLSVHHAYDPSTNTLFLGDGTQRNGYQLGTPVTYNGNLLLTSEDGEEVYVFDATSGNHLQTLRPLTGALVYQFGYDAVGKLVTVTDATGNVTAIQRNTAEEPTAIVSPYGQTTTLSVANGFLSQVTDPLGKSATFVNTTDGLLTSRRDQNGNIFNYTYDSNGRLAKDADPLGGFITAGRTDATSGFGWTVGETTSMGRTSSYQSTLTIPWIASSDSSFSNEHTNIWPDGLQATSSQQLVNGQLARAVTLPDGTSDNQTSEPDPVWGLQAPVSTSETLGQGSLKMNITGSRSTTLGTAGNPFSVATKTDTQTINDSTYTSTYTASNHTYVNKTPVGRALTVGLDSLERISSTQLGELAATAFTYDSRGRLAAATQSTRQTVFSYDTQGFLASITDPLQLTTSFGYDADGHLTKTTLPDGRVIGYAYDANGNLTSVTPPGKPAHAFAYTAVDLPSKYTPPADADDGATAYGYDLDRDPTTVTRPDGEKIEYGYDSAGRLNSITTPTETIEYTYDPATGNISRAQTTTTQTHSEGTSSLCRAGSSACSSSNAEAVAYEYNGPLPTSSVLTGAVAGTVSRTYNNNFWLASESIDDGTGAGFVLSSNSVNFTYDDDGLVKNAGPLTITYDSNDGLITGTTLNGVTDSRTYNTFGELTGETAKYNSGTLYSVTFTRDADGRISGKTETIGAQTNTYTYNYDKAGRLTDVTKNGASYSTYTYDSNSNRETATTPSGTANGTYDAQDRMLNYGDASYTYSANGELESRTAGSQSTTYTYDVLGNLIAAALPDGEHISYIIDPENRRVGRVAGQTGFTITPENTHLRGHENTELRTGYLYDGDRIVAQLDDNNQIVSRFVYATGATSPDYMVRGGVTYRIIADQLGSPVIMVNTSTGALAEQISYDEFGNVLSDTNPGFQPFGFAGGLYDQDTKLVRFGARDYDPSSGRWTAKDPIRFTGGDTNLYGYVLDEPINLVDPSGLQDEEGCSCPNIDQVKSRIKDLTEAAIQTAQNSATIVGAIAKVLIGYYGDGITGAGAAGGPGPGSQGAVMSVYGALKRQAELDDLVNAKYGRPKPCHLPRWLTESGYERYMRWQQSINPPGGGPQQTNPGYAEP